MPQLSHVEHNLHTITIASQEVKDVLLNLNVNKACGPDLISPRFPKEGAVTLASPFSIVFNRSLEQGYFTSFWKHGNVTPIYKKDDKSLLSNYRPITPLSQTGKTLERCVHKHMYNYVLERQMLTPFQSGFVPGDSTTYQLLHTYHTFCNAVDDDKDVRAVFCDINNAFDRVWLRGLLHKLSGIGCWDRVNNGSRVIYLDASSASNLLDKHLIGPLLKPGFLRGLSWDPYFFDIHKRYSEKYWLFYTVVRRRYKPVHNWRVCPDSCKAYQH